MPDLDVVFAAHLVQPSGPPRPALLEALTEAGDGVAAILAQVDDERRWRLLPPAAGVWQGRRWWADPRPPSDGRAGDVWFDTRELTLCLLLPRPEHTLIGADDYWRARMTPFESWLAVRPTSVWQYRGYCRATGRPAPTVADDLAATEPVRGLRGAEADDYCEFFGKAPATAFDWEAAAAFCTPAEATALWLDDGRELGGYAMEDAVVVLDREHALSAEPGGTDRAEKHLVDDGMPLPDVRFRTHVQSQIGILEDDDMVRRGGESGAGP